MVQIAAVKHWGLPHESLKFASWTQYTRKHNNMANSFYGSSQPFNCPSRCDSSKWPIEHIGNHGSQVTFHDQVPKGATLRKSIA
jgi:hypothetical protein